MNVIWVAIFVAMALVVLLFIVLANRSVDNRNLGKRLLEYREATGLSARKLGALLKCSRSTIRRVERGERVSEKLYARVAVRFNVLLGEYDPHTRSSTIQIDGK